MDMFGSSLSIIDERNEPAVRLQMLKPNILEVQCTDHNSDHACLICINIECDNKAMHCRSCEQPGGVFFVISSIATSPFLVTS